jgi:hypothetical protein
MRRLFALCAMGLFACFSFVAACGGSGSAAQDCANSGVVMCGNCSGAGCTCCPPSDPYWCVSSSGTASCYDTESDAMSACLSDVVHCG